MSFPKKPYNSVSVCPDCGCVSGVHRTDCSLKPEHSPFPWKVSEDSKKILFSEFHGMVAEFLTEEDAAYVLRLVTPYFDKLEDK